MVTPPITPTDGIPRRPAKPATRSRSASIRCSPEELRRLQAAAKLCNYDLSAWGHDLLLAAAAKVEAENPKAFAAALAATSTDDEETERPTRRKAKRS